MNSLDAFIIRCAEDCINSAEAGVSPPPASPDPALPPDAPTDEEVSASWRETIMPDYDEQDGSCGCGELGCQGRC